MAKKGGLGKGLDAIFYDNAREDDAGAVELSINDLEPNRTQPRQSFDDGAMTELADSIAQHGVLQPILVRPLLSGGYQIVAGGRADDRTGGYPRPDGQRSDAAGAD